MYECSFIVSVDMSSNSIAVTKILDSALVLRDMFVDVHAMSE